MHGRRLTLFVQAAPNGPGAQPFSIVIPPPNVTGSLHMGHALNNTLQDILCRFERMRGKDVLWQPGTDHAGIATQMVVERQLAERQQPDRRTMGREKFLERVWEWKAESGGAIVNQLKRLGASCDWSRERFTMDEGMTQAVIKTFVQLHRDGLIYRDKRLVNWDPKFETAISDLEVVQVECKGSVKWERGGEAEFDAAALAKALSKDPNGHLYYFDYPLEDGSGVITVATTRPETMLGDTAVAVHPENENLKHLIGRNIVLPLVGGLVPIIGDDYADPEKGTGAVKITPAHDFNDFEVGKRHDLKQINILNAKAEISLAELDGAPAGLDGLDRFAARTKVVEMIHALGLLAKIEPHAHQVPHGDRSGVVIEPFLTDQWYVDAHTLAQPALAAVRDGKTGFVPKNWEKTYFDWLDNIQPWCISRQLWWGHQIPAWYSGWGGIYVAETQEDALVQALADAVTREIMDDVEAGRIADDPELAADFLTRDEDVLDTWFSSALWPFSTLGWPDETPELARFYPTSVLVTGFDIIFFWVARMMMMGLHLRHEIPFRDIYIHALVRDAKGAKMSKSKGNVIDPLDLIDQYGADALRFTLAAMAAQGRDIKLAGSRVEGYRNFATKLWNAARFAEMNGCARDTGYLPAGNSVALNRWIVGEAQKAVAEVTSAIEAYRFNEAANGAYRFVWNIVCDWYVELAKPLLQGADGGEKNETRATMAFVLDQAVALLHPFMPFITEELWAQTGQSGVLALAAWPELNGLEDQAAEGEIGWVIDLISEIRSVRAEMLMPASLEATIVFIDADADLRERAERWGETLRRLARVGTYSFALAAPPESALMVVRGQGVALPLAGLVDLDAERARLKKEIAKTQSDISKTEAKLGNADFIARAPEEIVEENRERLETWGALLVKLQAAQARLA